MKSGLRAALWGGVLLLAAGCTVFEDPVKTRAEVDSQRENWASMKTAFEIQQLETTMNDSVYSDRERQERLTALINGLTDSFKSNEPANMATLDKLTKELKNRRDEQLKQLAAAVGKLGKEGAASLPEAEDKLEQVRPLVKQLADLRDLPGSAAAGKDLEGYVMSLFRAHPKLLISADKAFRDFPSETNRRIMELALGDRELLKDPQIKDAALAIRRNFESVVKTEKKFEQFLKAPDQIHWDAFKNQTARIGYDEKAPARRRFAEYIDKIDHCRRIIFTLKYWELAGTGFIDRKKGDIGIRIWTSQNKPFIRQIAVENADRNWHADPFFHSIGNQKKITHPLIARSDNDIIRMVCIHFQNSSLVTVESPIFEYSIYQLAALSFKTGEGELKLEAEPVNRPAGPYKGLVVMGFRDMPKLESYSE